MGGGELLNRLFTVGVKNNFIERLCSKLLTAATVKESFMYKILCNRILQGLTRILLQKKYCIFTASRIKNNFM